MRDNAYEKLYEIERKYNVEGIKYDGICLWPFIRNDLYMEYELYEEISSGMELWSTRYKKNESKFVRLLNSIRVSSTGLFDLKHADLLYTDSGQQRYCNGRYIEKITNEILKNTEKLIPVVGFSSNTQIRFTDKYIDQDVIRYIGAIGSRILKFDENKYEGRQTADRIYAELGLKNNLRQMTLRLLTLIKFYRKWFARIKPGYIYMVSYYELDKLAAIYAAKEMHIPVIEFSHGIIMHSHTAYNTEKKIEKAPYPDFLFVFGERFKTFVSEKIYDKNAVKVIGNYYIEELKAAKSKNTELFNKKYRNWNSKCIITVASQTYLDKELLKFFIQFARRQDQYSIVFVPRLMKAYHKKVKERNLVIESELDVYQCMQNSDITATVASSCAYESLAFGTPVILVKINDTAKNMKLNFFPDTKSVMLVEDMEKMEACIKHLAGINENAVLEESRKFFGSGHKQLLKQAMYEVLSEFE